MVDQRDDLLHRDHVRVGQVPHVELLRVDVLLDGERLTDVLRKEVVDLLVVDFEVGDGDGVFGLVDGLVDFLEDVEERVDDESDVVELGLLDGILDVLDG